jgi:hypothetical protein
MAHIERFGSYVILALTPREKFFGFHASPQAKYSDIISIRKVEKVWNAKILRGVRAPGTGLPWVIALGTWRLRKGKNFVCVYGKRPAYVFTFGGGSFNQWIVTPDNSEEEMRSLFYEILSDEQATG